MMKLLSLLIFVFLSITFIKAIPNKQKIYKKHKIVALAKRKMTIKIRNNLSNAICHNLLIDTQYKTSKMSAQDSIWFAQQEDLLIEYINIFQTDTSMQRVKYYDSLFIRKFAECVKSRFSYSYPFLKLQDYIYIVYPDDSLFRIITWQYTLNAMTVEQQGLIQLKGNDSSTVFYPLLDRSNLIHKPLDTITSNVNWIGALYYDIVSSNDKKGNKIYTLIGLDENTLLSNKKWIDILSFDNNCKPIFGGNFFDFSKRKIITDNTKIELNEINSTPKRFYIEYNKSFQATLKFDEDLDIIIFDALVPNDEGIKSRKYSYQIDGQYEGFKWENGKWHFVPQVFNFELPNGKVPNEKPLDFDNSGNPIIETIEKK